MVIPTDLQWTSGKYIEVYKSSCGNQKQADFVIEEKDTKIRGLTPITLSDTVSRKQINDLWEAIHEIPDLVKRWRPDAESELMMYLKEYNEKWQEPNLLAVFEDGKHRE